VYKNNQLALKPQENKRSLLIYRPFHYITFFFFFIVLLSFSYGLLSEIKLIDWLIDWLIAQQDLYLSNREASISSGHSLTRVICRIVVDGISMDVASITSMLPAMRSMNNQWNGTFLGTSHIQRWRFGHCKLINATSWRLLRGRHKLSNRWKTARRICGNAMARLRPPCMYYQHAEFGRSALKDVGINTGELPKLGRVVEALRNALYKFKTYLLTYFVTLLGGVADPKIHASPWHVLLCQTW